MNVLRLGLAVAALSMGVSCSSSSDDSGPAEPPLGLSDNALRLAIGAQTIQPGDTFECWFLDYKTPSDLFVNHASGKQGAGGHHIAVFYAQTPQPVGHHACDEQEMTNWRQITATSGDSNSAEGVVGLPSGVAVTIPAGQQIVVQTHYINATAQPRDVEDEVTLHLLKKEEVKQYAQGLAIFDGTFNIPPQADYKHAGTCTLDRDYDLIVSVGHMHEHGAHYLLEKLDDKGNPVDTILDNAWEPAFASHPPERHWDVATPYHLPKGTKIRQTCEWKNEGADPVGFPREMCVSFSWYLSDNGFQICNADADKPN